jgi:hypothetical protein
MPNVPNTASEQGIVSREATLCVEKPERLGKRKHKSRQRGLGH